MLDDIDQGDNDETNYDKVDNNENDNDDVDDAADENGLGRSLLIVLEDIELGENDKPQ